VLPEPFGSDGSVVALDVSILLGASRLDIHQSDAAPRGPCPQSSTDIFGAVVHAYIGGAVGVYYGAASGAIGGLLLHYLAESTGVIDYDLAGDYMASLTVQGALAAADGAEYLAQLIQDFPGFMNITDSNGNTMAQVLADNTDSESSAINWANFYAAIMGIENDGPDIDADDINDDRFN
jgi:hypothetical protein